MIPTKMRKDFYIFNNGIVTERGMSGSDRRALEWSRIWQKEGHGIHLFIPQAGYKRYESLKPSAKLVITSSLKPATFGLFFTYLYRALRASFRQPPIGEDAIIYSSCDLLVDTLPAIYMKLHNRKAKWMTGLHLVAPNPFKGFKKAASKGLVFPGLSTLYFFLFQRLIIFFMGHLASLILVSNRQDKKFLMKKKIPENKILVTYGGVNLKEVGGIKGRKKYEASFIGRLHPQKGIPDLFQAWSKVVEQFPRAKLAIIAEPNLQEYFEKQAEFKELRKNIDFLGFLDGKKKFQAIKSSKMLLFPSYYESFGMVACEALACRLPVVAYDLPIFREIYPRGMIRVPVGNVRDLARAAIDLLVDEKKREKFSRAAVSMAGKFSWDKTADTILKRL